MKDTIYKSLNLNGFFLISKKKSIELIKEIEKKKRTYMFSSTKFFFTSCHVNKI